MSEVNEQTFNIGSNNADLLGALQEKHTGEPYYTLAPDGHNPYASKTPTDMMETFASQYPQTIQLEELRNGLDGIFGITPETPNEEWPELYTEARQAIDQQIEKSKEKE